MTSREMSAVKGFRVTSITTEQMREVGRLMIEESGSCSCR
jgi:hypothetical protein